MKLLVCGGRDFDDAELLVRELNKYLPNVSHVIHGDARGADSLAGGWALANGIQEVKCPANWNRFDKRAGYLRNQAMLELNPDIVVAFPGGKGTAMMIDIAGKQGFDIDKY